jgi:hypothetical protein
VSRLWRETSTKVDTEQKVPPSDQEDMNLDELRLWQSFCAATAKLIPSNKVSVCVTLDSELQDLENPIIAPLRQAEADQRIKYSVRRCPEWVPKKVGKDYVSHRKPATQVGSPP